MRRTSAVCRLLVALLLVALLLLAACTPDRPGGDRPDVTGEEAQLAHAQCMRDHGIDWPDPELVDGEWEIRVGDGVDLETAEFKRAEAACAPVGDGAPAGAADPADRAHLEEEMERMLTFAACMRDEGVDFPDPVLSDDGTISGPAGPLDGDQAAFDAARRTCEDRTGAPMP